MVGLTESKKLNIIVTLSEKINLQCSVYLLFHSGQFKISICDVVSQCNDGCAQICITHLLKQLEQFKHSASKKTLLLIKLPQNTKSSVECYNHWRQNKIKVTHIISKFFVVTLKLKKKSSNFLLLRMIQTSGINSAKI